jgi:hypothetical protein
VRVRVARTAGYAGLALAGVAVLAVPRVSFPADTGTWAPVGLPGAAVRTLAGTGDGVLVAHDDRLELVRDDGSLQGFDMPAPARSLAAAGDTAYAGTGDGVVLAPLDGAPSRAIGLAGMAVHAVDVHEGAVHAGTGEGLHRRDTDGSWSRIWPPPGEPAAAVTAVLAVAGAVLFVHDGAVLRWSSGPGQVVVSLDGTDAVSLSRGSRPAQVWAGLRAGALLLESRDGGRSWQARGDGLGLSTVEDVATDPTAPAAVLASGTGLADGRGANAGVQRSSDGGHTWQVQQDRLSNTHVFAVEIREERFTLELDVPGTSGVRLTLPVQQNRSYAATNGGGLYSARPANAVASGLAAAHPVLRVAEPLLLGLVALLCLVPAYLRLAQPARRQLPSTTTWRKR